MSKILDKIKGFGHSLTSMFKENDQEDVDYLNPDTEEAKKLAAAMKPAVDRINSLEKQREKDQKAREEWLKNLREGDAAESGSTIQAQEGQVRQTRLSAKSKDTQSQEMSPKSKNGQSKEGKDLEIE